MATGPDGQILTKDRGPSHEEQDQVQDDCYEGSFTTCNCFSRRFCFPCGRRSSDNTERRTLLQGECKESWWVNRVRRIKEFTELLAGPKWKTFIRRFNNNNNTNNIKKRKPQFQYDPLSYALNFDNSDSVNFSVRLASSGKNGNESVLVENSKTANQSRN